MTTLPAISVPVGARELVESVAEVTPRTALMMMGPREVVKAGGAMVGITACRMTQAESRMMKLIKI